MSAAYLPLAGTDCSHRRMELIVCAERCTSLYVICLLGPGSRSGGSSGFSTAEAFGTSGVPAYFPSSMQSSRHCLCWLPMSSSRLPNASLRRYRRCFCYVVHIRSCPPHALILSMLSAKQTIIDKALSHQSDRTSCPVRAPSFISDALLLLFCLEFVRGRQRLIALPFCGPSRRASHILSNLLYCGKDQRLQVWKK